MKKYDLSKIMKRAWELVKKAAHTMSNALKKAWEEAKELSEKIKFEGNAKVAKLLHGESNPYIGTEYDSDSNYFFFRRWKKNGYERIYVNDYKGRSVAYIDCCNENSIVTNYSCKSEVWETVKHFLETYNF